METIKTYKLLRLDDVGLHPLFIDRFLCLPMGEWIEAKAPTLEALFYEPNGYSLINLYSQRVMERRTTKPKPDEVARACIRFCRWIEVRTNKRNLRRYYDLGLSSNGKQVVSFAHRPGWHTSAKPSLPTVNMYGKVWAECLIPADDYYIIRRSISGITRTHEPIEWFISQKILITRLLDDTQINDIKSAKAGM